MKARMEVTLDTTFTNQVVASVECELDNPHSLTARALVELMVQRLRFMAEEIRHANERAIPDILGDAGAPPREMTGTPERERQAFEDMRRERDTGSIFAGRREEEQPET